MDRSQKRPRRDNIGEFLKSMEGVDIGQGGSAESAAVAEGQPAQNHPKLTIGAVLSWLKTKGATSIPDVAIGLQSPLLNTVELLGTLQASGLVSIEGRPGIEVVSLTKAGRTLATVA